MAATKLTTIAAFFLFTFALLIPATAQDLPETPKPAQVSYKEFWSMIAAQQAATAYDGYWTVRNIEQGGREHTWIYGTHPHAIRYSVTSEAINGITAYAGFRLMHSQKKLVRALGIAILNVQTIEHLEGGVYSQTHSRIIHPLDTPPAQIEPPCSSTECQPL